MSVWQKLKKGIRELAARGGGAACPAVVRPALSRLEQDLRQNKTEPGDLLYSRYCDCEPCNGPISRLCREIAVLNTMWSGGGSRSGNQPGALPNML